MSKLTRFLGDSPLRVLVRLVIFSFIVGIVLSALNLNPWQIYWWIERVVLSIYDRGFAFLIDSLDYLIAGAMIVVPLFLLMRVLKVVGRQRRSE